MKKQIRYLTAPNFNFFVVTDSEELHEETD